MCLDEAWGGCRRCIYALDLRCNGKDVDGMIVIVSTVLSPRPSSFHFLFGFCLFGAGCGVRVRFAAGDGKTTLESSTIPRNVLHTKSNVEHKSLIFTPRSFEIPHR